MENIRQQILDLLQYDPLSRTQISRSLEVARSTIYDNLVVLETAQRVERYTPKDRERKPSRPIVKWRLR